MRLHEPSIRLTTAHRVHQVVRGLACGLWIVCAGGCPVTTPLPTAADVQERQLRGGGTKYYLYVPSTYDRSRSYPLVIACHGTNPWDDAWAQIREWAAFAERKDIIVAAPILRGTRGDFRPDPARQLELQRADERTLLDLVAALKGAYSIAEEQVFLTGWSAGAFAILHTGLRHPEVFRALAIRQGTFDERFMDIDSQRLDRWQPILVFFGATDPLREESIKAITWLRENDLFVERLEVPGSHRRLDVNIAWEFFRKIVRERPWIRLNAVKPDSRNRLLVRYWCESKPEFRRIVWDFGDGQTSEEPSPSHVYAAPGAYQVSAKVSLRGSHTYERKLWMRVGPPDAAVPSRTPPPADQPAPADENVASPAAE